MREVMRTNVVTLSAALQQKELAHILRTDGQQRGRQRLYPVMDSEGRLTGVVTRSDLQDFAQQWEQHAENASPSLAELVQAKPVVAYPDEPLRQVVYRMAETNHTRFPVVERDDPQRLLGIVSLSDLLKARVRNLEEERVRERVLRVHHFLPRGARKAGEVKDEVKVE